MLDFGCSILRSARLLPGAVYPLLRQIAHETNPFFHPEVLRPLARSFNLPERVRDWQPKLQH